METMNLIITLRKDVPDRETGKAIYQLVKKKLEDHPEIIITAHVTNHFDLEE